MTPASVAEAGELLTRLAREKKTVLFTGAGTKLPDGPPADVTLRTEKLSRILEYVPEDQVVTAEAGVPLRALQEALRRHGQRLSIDPPFADRATLGGIVASASFGPMRARFGAPRDLILGATMVRADGVVAKGGGKVVKNVAGFDLPKLLCGSYGTLALIATVTFRVHPLPEMSAVLRAAGLAPEAVVALMLRVRALQLEPTAMVATRAASGGYDVDVLFEGFEAGVRQQVTRLPELAQVNDDGLRAHAKLRETARIKVASLPTLLPRVDAAVSGAFAWYPLLGLGFTDGRVEAGAFRGTVVDEREGLRPTPPSRRLHEAVKHRFDPDGRLGPGRFFGGV